GFPILAAQGPPLRLLDTRKLPRPTEAHLTQLGELRAPSALDDELRRPAPEGARIALDPTLAAEQLRLIVEAAGGTVVSSADPCRLPRATKNAAELAGSGAAHRRDGAAVAKSLAWVDAQPAGSIDEIAAAQKLEALR